MIAVHIMVLTAHAHLRISGAGSSSFESKAPAGLLAELPGDLEIRDGKISVEGGAFTLDLAAGDDITIKASDDKADTVVLRVTPHVKASSTSKAPAVPGAHSGSVGGNPASDELKQEGISERMTEKVGRNFGKEDHVAVVWQCSSCTTVSMDWLKNVMPVDELLGHNYGRDVGEAKPWLVWIVDHYDDLPKYTVFLHGQERQWHEEYSPDDLRQRPPSVQMLARPECTWTKHLEIFLTCDWNNVQELPALDAVYSSLFGKTFLQAWDDWNMVDRYRCCSEMMVPRNAIRAVPKSAYIALLNFMDSHPTIPWGYVFERTWQNLFSKPLLPSAARTLAARAKARFPLPKVSFVQCPPGDPGALNCR